MTDTGIDWPPELPRTPEGKRSSTSAYQANLGQTTKQLAREMDRLGADKFRASIGNGHTKSNGLPLHNARPDDPGFVLRWTKDGDQFVVGCDDYTHLRDNVREVFMWMKETRKAGDRKVKTGQSQFAAAALPAADDDAVVAEEPPHEVLGVAPDADPEIVSTVARKLKARHHPEGAEPDSTRFKRVCKAEEALVDE
ncbi:J domain-containing protein [Natronosalvus rutilus]|uniref:J domain-containing protein n=1 Tax=Natronosalvus rutilus TaxID=2953753 RepID=A0A9E7NDV0_9EURY|nr:J domain-containing protein [Natronosalvus rutilus]UTF56040.1 J domain-containing protein [Natronosalvus rutilus]